MRGAFAALAAAASIASAAAPGEGDLIPMLRAARAHGESLEDYTAVFHKQQRVGGTLHAEEKILFKFRKPFMVYMKWLDGAHAGREALFVRGEHGDRLLVHPGGLMNLFAPTVSLDPRGMLAMRGNLRPITEAGILNAVNLLLEVCESAARRGDLDVRDLGPGEADGRPTRRFERILPRKDGYPAHRTLIEMDAETGLPLSVESYGWEGELLEKYRWRDLRSDTGLGTRDFDRSNREYGFGYIVAPIP
ncbi:MAG: DUF1571 domain-containing protein [bacterium]|nr:DUF1571 domain-containing protein [bacterium]